MYKVLIAKEATEEIFETRCNTFNEYVQLVNNLAEDFVVLNTEFVEIDTKDCRYFYNNNKPEDLVEGSHE